MSPCLYDTFSRSLTLKQKIDLMEYSHPCGITPIDKGVAKEFIRYLKSHGFYGDILEAPEGTIDKIFSADASIGGFYKRGAHVTYETMPPQGDRVIVLYAEDFP